ncbi:Crp/Fnr family transcriptional regulator [Pedobacter sp. UBA4863]|mgnify:CR=1 FL=1|uniref:Crp/Fnr family transcriptional regulator n=1 Tax=Pedobacter sp. UBA4863 TaxID=1947060 RepID=UPI0025E34F57|nr:Crp/Fnr family transcriptional regulator [Pedobacter sp. UBA4863]
MQEDSFQHLAQFVKEHFVLPDKSVAEFVSIWSSFSAVRKELLTQEGEQEKYLYFVLEGVQRVYALNNEGKEATLIFTYAPSFGGVLDAMMTSQKSKYYYETLTPSSFLRAPITEVKRLMHRNPEIASMINIGVSQALGGVLDRLVELQLMSSEEKFRTLLARSPHILTLVPHKYLASYLGIDATNFSKLMNSVKI